MLRALNVENVTRDNNATRNTNNARDQRLRSRMLRFFSRMFRYRQFRRDSSSLSRRLDVCTNVHVTRKVTVCCKYICSEAENSNNERQEFFNGAASADLANNVGTPRHYFLLTVTWDILVFIFLGELECGRDNVKQSGSG